MRISVPACDNYGCVALKGRGLMQNLIKVIVSSVNLIVGIALFYTLSRHKKGGNNVVGFNYFNKQTPTLIPANAP